ncbi:hypothetical protein SBOR_5117 [Sclerotinia borealis F-4128]|uniref:Uncharacterized protein n=1 Tax=Sclerotinia borealis (strain F-4128) TaxID=1432307 RepID=W9CII8_SCLBF|nr:hypothetical protein SBOR_5117 [Sclerotinia borealis F-4128]
MKTPIKNRDRPMYNIYKALGFRGINGSELKKKLNTLELPVVRVKSSQQPEARRLAERFCEDNENTIALWPEHVDGNAPRLKKKAVSKLGLDSDHELLTIPRGCQSLRPRAQQLEDDYISSRSGASLNPAAEPLAVGQIRRSSMNELRDNIHVEDYFRHIRQIVSTDDKGVMRDFVSQQWLEEDTGASWTGQGSLEPDNYILRFMHEFMYYGTTPDLCVTKFLGLFHEDPSIKELGNYTRYNTLKGRLRDRVRKLAASLVVRRLLLRNRSTGIISRTKELDEAWERRNEIWSQPCKAIGETVPHSTRRRDSYKMHMSLAHNEPPILDRGSSSDPAKSKQPHRADLSTGFRQEQQQQQQEMHGLFTAMDEGEPDDQPLIGSRNLPGNQPLHLESSDFMIRENNLDERQRFSTYNQLPTSKDKGKGVDRGQNDPIEVSQHVANALQSNGTSQIRSFVQLIEDVLARNTLLISKLTLTHPISPRARAAAIKLELTPIPGTSYGSQFRNSTLPRQSSTGYGLNPRDSKPSPFLTPSPQPEAQAPIEEPSSEDDLPIATFTHNINFVLLGKQRFDFEHPLIFQINDLEDLSLSSFISVFAERTGIKEHKIDGLKFTILLGDNRSETVMKGDKRRWQQIVEIIGDLWKYSQVEWANNPKSKTKICKILTEKVIVNA